MRDQRARRALRAPQTFTEWTIADCERSIHERFGQQVESSPETPAVSLVSGDVTYAQLNRDSDRAARAVREAVGPDSRPVALLCPQGYESIVWTLGVLKSGVPYAPLDQRLPTSNLRRMIDFLDPSALLAAEAHLELGRTLGSQSHSRDCCARRAPERRTGNGRMDASPGRQRRRRLHLLHVGIDRHPEGRRRHASKRPAQRPSLYKHFAIWSRRSTEPGSESELQRNGVHAVRRAAERRDGGSIRPPGRWIVVVIRVGSTNADHGVPRRPFDLPHAVGRSR